MNFTNPNVIIGLVLCIIISLFVLYIKAPSDYLNAIPTLTEKIAMLVLIITICLILSIFMIM